jgi:hypothetical protein
LFEKAMELRLDEDFFSELCNSFFEIIEESEMASTNAELQNIFVRAWPALVVFDEISKYPEWDETGNMLRRLERVRKTTEAFSYDLAKKVIPLDYPREYVFFQGKVFEVSFEDFCREKEIIVENE